MTDALFEFVEINREANGVVPTPKEDFFALGWISLDGALALKAKINAELNLQSIDVQKSFEPLATIVEFILRLELLMAKYTSDSFFTNVKLLEGFLEEQRFLIQFVSPNNKLQFR